MEKELTYLVALVVPTLIALIIMSRDRRTFLTHIHPEDAASAAKKV